jgi:molybdate transport system substrate-binding protein
MHRLLSGVCIFILFLAACQSQPDSAQTTGETNSVVDSGQSSRLLIAAAADLRFALPELNDAFNKLHPTVKLETIFGASGSLAAQIENGLPADVFLCADERYPQRLIQAGLAAPQDYFRYARGQLALCIPANSTLAKQSDGITLLTKSSIGRLAIANPRTAPYGQAAMALLEKLNLAEVYRNRLLLADNVMQALQFAESGNADAAIVSKSLALAAEKATRWFEIPEEFYPPIIQGGVLLKKTSARQLAQQWRDFLLSPAGQAVLSRYGYTSPDSTTSSSP